MRRHQMLALGFSQSGTVTEQIQHTAQRLQRIVDFVDKRSCQTSSSGQLFCCAQYLFGSFAMREIKEGKHRRDDTAVPVENWGRADTKKTGVPSPRTYSISSSLTTSPRVRERASGHSSGLKSCLLRWKALYGAYSSIFAA